MGSIAPQQDQKPYGYVYKITNLVNGKVYVGQTTHSVGFRWSQHYRSAMRGKNKSLILQEDIIKYGRDSFKVDILCEAGSPSDLTFKEMEFISKTGSLIPEGYNTALGPKGIHPSTRKKLSQLSLKMWENEEHREKISASLKGKTKSEETRAKLSKAHTGRKYSEERCRRMSELAISRGTRFPPKAVEVRRSDSTLEKLGQRWFTVFDLDGNLLGRFINKRKCAKHLGVLEQQVHAWVSGRKKSRTYIFKYTDDQ